MTVTTIDICNRVTEIRQLAALCQNGEDLSLIRGHIDRVLQDFNASLQRDRRIRLAAWSELLTHLERYFSNMSDPRWLDAMNHARLRVKSRRQTALNYGKKNEYR